MTKILKKEAYGKRLQEQLSSGQVDWNYVFNGYIRS